MAYQDLANKAGITVTDEDVENFVTENGMEEEDQESYGKAYLIQTYILPGKVQDYLAEHAVIE